MGWEGSRGRTRPDRISSRPSSTHKVGSPPGGRPLDGTRRPTPPLGEANPRRYFMARTSVTGSPGFISIAVSDAQKSAAFYERYLGAVRDTFDFGPDAVAFVGWPTFAV